MHIKNPRPNNHKWSVISVFLHLLIICTNTIFSDLLLISLLFSWSFADIFALFLNFSWYLCTYPFPWSLVDMYLIFSRISSCYVLVLFPDIQHCWYSFSCALANMYLLFSWSLADIYNYTIYMLLFLIIISFIHFLTILLQPTPYFLKYFFLFFLFLIFCLLLSSSCTMYPRILLCILPPFTVY